jgi:hypothetical protein
VKLESMLAIFDDAIAIADVFGGSSAKLDRLSLCSCKYRVSDYDTTCTTSFRCPVRRLRIFRRRAHLLTNLKTSNHVISSLLSFGEAHMTTRTWGGPASLRSSAISKLTHGKTETVPIVEKGDGGVRGYDGPATPSLRFS